MTDATDPAAVRAAAESGLSESQLARDEAREALQTLEALIREGKDPALTWSPEWGFVAFLPYGRNDPPQGAGDTLPLAIQALAAQLPGMAGKQSEAKADEGEMKEAGER